MKKAKKRRVEPKFEDISSSSQSYGSMQKEKNLFPSKPSRSKIGSSKKTTFFLRRPLFHHIGHLLYWCLILSIWSGIGFVGLLVYYGALLPNVTTWSIPARPPNIRILSADGRLLVNRGPTGGETLPLSSISPFLRQAVIAIEDRRFYSHLGIDLTGILRATITNLFKGDSLQGGSTITQQLAKNLFLSAERTLKRKIQELLLSFWLEKKYSKDNILEMYLNRVYFGSGAYGVAAASIRYFSKPAHKLTLPESALLAALLKAPSRLSPVHHPTAATKRAQIVLEAMLDENMIRSEEYKHARDGLLLPILKQRKGTGDHAADRIVSLLPFLIGEIDTDILVQTTIDYDLQKFAETQIRSLIETQGKKFDVSEGALISIDNTGAVRAMVGGRDYASSSFDRASEARRQPGSAFKPFVYLAALERGRTPETIRNDAPVRIGNWEPKNYNQKYYGYTTLSKALALSLNSVAVQLVSEIGPDYVVKVAHRLGIRSNLQKNFSIALGSSEVTLLELTSAYVPFSNGGYRPEIRFIESVSTADGKKLYLSPPDTPVRVLDPMIVNMMNSMMSRTLREGTARNANFGWPAAGKTGTSQNFRDAWFIGYTSLLTTGVWFGNDNGKPSNHLSGGRLPAIAWREFMATAHKRDSFKPFSRKIDSIKKPDLSRSSCDPAKFCQDKRQDPIRDLIQTH